MAVNVDSISAVDVDYRTSFQRPVNEDFLSAPR